MTSTTIALLVAAPLIAWRLYSRFRRMIGRQKLSPVRPWVTVVFLPTVILFLGMGVIAHPERIAWLACGLIAGALLGAFGLRRTRFESTPDGWFYTPNAHLGILVSLLLVVRVVYRIVIVGAIDPGAAQGPYEFARTPATLAVFGLLAGYYVTYAIGLLRWRFRGQPPRPAVEERAGGPGA